MEFDMDGHESTQVEQYKYKLLQKATFSRTFLSEACFFDIIQL